MVGDTSLWFSCRPAINNGACSAFRLISETNGTSPSPAAQLTPASSAQVNKGETTALDDMDAAIYNSCVMEAKSEW